MSALIKVAAACIRLLRGEVSTARLKKMGLVVGKRFTREGGVRIDTSNCHLITIGDDVILAPNVHILAHDASLKNFLGVNKLGRVTIGSRVFVGANSVVLPGVNIGDDVIVGAGSVVSRSLPGGGVYAGNPAKLVCSIQDIVERNAAKLPDSPFFEKDYRRSSPPAEMKRRMKEALAESIGFQECENYAQIQSARRQFRPDEVPRSERDRAS